MGWHGPSGSCGCCGSNLCTDSNPRVYEDDFTGGLRSDWVAVIGTVVGTGGIARFDNLDAIKTPNMSPPSPFSSFECAVDVVAFSGSLWSMDLQIGLVTTFIAINYSSNTGQFQCYDGTTTHFVTSSFTLGDTMGIRSTGKTGSNFDLEFFKNSTSLKTVANTVGSSSAVWCPTFIKLQAQASPSSTATVDADNVYYELK